MLFIGKNSTVGEFCTTKSVISDALNLIMFLFFLSVAGKRPF